MVTEVFHPSHRLLLKWQTSISLKCLYVYRFLFTTFCFLDSKIFMQNNIHCAVKGFSKAAVLQLCQEIPPSTYLTASLKLWVTTECDHSSAHMNLQTTKTNTNKIWNLESPCLFCWFVWFGLIGIFVVVTFCFMGNM